jgi:hypothetical protein
VALKFLADPRIHFRAHLLPRNGLDRALVNLPNAPFYDLVPCGLDIRLRRGIEAPDQQPRKLAAI